MGRYASDEGGGEFQQIPPGTYIARCIRLIDLGTQHGEYMGKPTVNNQIMIMFETPEEMIEVGGEQKPYIVSLFINNWLGGKSKLKTLLESWRGRAFTPDEVKRFDLENVLGQPAVITVVHNEKGKAKIGSIGKLMKNMTCPPATSKPESFWLDDFSAEKFDKLPKGIQGMVQRSDEYKQLNGGAPPENHDQSDVQPRRTEDFDDDIPFVQNECTLQPISKFERRMRRHDTR